MSKPLPPRRRPKLAIVGAGPSALYLLKNLLLQDATRLLASIDVYEQRPRPGTGMPYDPATTDRHNLCNISSEEMPPLAEGFADWLRQADEAVLRRYDLHRQQVSDEETYPRALMGEYFAQQFTDLAERLGTAGVPVTVHAQNPVKDLIDEPADGRIAVVTDNGRQEFDRVVIATGHVFGEEDDPANGHFTSPWPIGKLLPKEGTFHNFEVGTLGASLSAFDVVAALAHRHGTFEPVGDDGALKFVPSEGADDFRLVMHSAEGWLPHLQYEQREPMRQVYRHVTREQLLNLAADNVLRLSDYWDRVMRPALVDALRHDNLPAIADDLAGGLSMEDWVERMKADHTYADAFEGMRQELPEARRSLDRDEPIRWKEVLDDLMYALNYHAELLPGEDHVRLRSVLMSFLMNVIAALPIESARKLLALRDADRLDLRSGYVTVKDKRDGQTFIDVDGEEHVFRMFVDCGGQGTVTIDNYPFPSLTKAGTVRAAAAPLADADADVPDGRRTELNGRPAVQLDGIAIDPGYRVIGTDGQPNPRLLDIGFPHTLGLRPYSYGLQACNHTAEMVVATWLRDAAGDEPDAVADFAEVEATVPSER